MADSDIPTTGAEARRLGKSRYFPGRPCKRGHISNYYASSGTCVTCLAEKCAEAYAATPEKFRAKSRSNYWADPESHREAAKNWAIKNPERKKAADAAYYAEHREQDIGRRKASRDADIDNARAKDRARYGALTLEQKATRQKTARVYRLGRVAQDRAVNRAWRLANHDRLRQSRIERDKRNPERVTAHSRNMKAKRRGAIGRVTAGQIRALFTRQNGRCANPACREPIKDGYHADHIIPIRLNGQNVIRNIQLLCAPCNFRKSGKHPIDFALENGLLV